MTPRILIIAGSDSGGGAGIQADIKTVTLLGGHAMTAITAVTAQDTLGVDAVHPIPTDVVIQQIDAVVSDIGVDAVKIGMIGSAETAEAVAEALKKLAIPIIFDPVMVATSGAPLADASTIAAFEALMALACLTTPNLPELNALGGSEAVLRHGCHLLIKGGHGDGDEVTDQLLSPDGDIRKWVKPRIESAHTHGTGCTLASAAATGMAQGLPLEEAVACGIDFVRLSLHDAPELGQGNGPLGQQKLRNDGVMPGILLNQVTVGASDYQASVAFYQNIGLLQIVDSPANGYARFEADNGVTLSIHSGEAPASDTVIYFESRRLDEWCAELADSGFEFDQMPHDESWGWREARLKDPHGNKICLYQAGENRRYPPWRI